MSVELEPRLDPRDEGFSVSCEAICGEGRSVGSV